MTVAHVSHTATALQSGLVLVAGGQDANGQGVAAAEVWDPIDGTFSATGSLLAGRGQQTATLLKNGEVLITGGTDGDSTLATAEIYQP
jgi:hypothetical protein